MGVLFGFKGYTTSTVISWLIAITKESAVDIMAARLAVKAITPVAFAKPPKFMIASRIDEKGLVTASPPRICTPTVPRKILTNMVSHGPIAMIVHEKRNVFKSRAAYRRCIKCGRIKNDTFNSENCQNCHWLSPDGV
jgi:hypothetical protein